MAEGSLEIVLRRDRLVVTGALAALAAFAWSYVLWLAFGMTMSAGSGGAAGMAGMGDMLAPTLRPWSAAEFAFVLTMWAVMMVGMMTPSAAPMILIYARVARAAASQGRPFAPTGWFAAGYLLCWTGFALLATSAQWGLERAALLAPTTARAGDALGGLVLLAAGLYQLTPLKNACLVQCQSPLFFIHRHGGFRADAPGSFRLGLTHGAYCVGCCWALMTLLFVGGVMNVLWIVGLTALVLLEKLSPPGRILPILVGCVLSAAGVWLLAASGSVAVLRQRQARGQRP
jgi:predicted metal-binding membrane protein